MKHFFVLQEASTSSFLCLVDTSVLESVKNFSLCLLWKSLTAKLMQSSSLLSARVLKLNFCLACSYDMYCSPRVIFNATFWIFSSVQTCFFVKPEFQKATKSYKKLLNSKVKMWDVQSRLAQHRSEDAQKWILEKGPLPQVKKLLRVSFSVAVGYLSWITDQAEEFSRSDFLIFGWGSCLKLEKRTSDENYREEQAGASDEREVFVNMSTEPTAPNIWITKP